MSAILILLIPIVAAAGINFCNGSFRKGCLQSEREAFLLFKQDLIDDTNRLASWIDLDEDCCGWVGVVCDNMTGHVLELSIFEIILNLSLMIMPIILLIIMESFLLNLKPST